MSKPATPRASRSSLTDTIRSSLALKLNLYMFGGLLSAFLFINVLLCVLLLGAAVWKVEIGAQQLLDSFDVEKVNEGQPYAALGYRITTVLSEERGFVLPEQLQQWLPLSSPGAGRQAVVPAVYAKLPLPERLWHTEYRITLAIDDRSWQISYALGRDIRTLTILLLVILLGELLYSLRRLRGNARVIRQILRPLTEMAQTARSLHEGMVAVEALADGTGLKHLEGAISSINAEQLDSRLSVDSSQDELKDLARAINDMLNRISDSYESQVRFVADASHELRTPISVIQGYANLLDRWGKHDEKTIQESVDAIKGEAENMKVLVEQLLFLARGDSETIQLHKAVVDICGVIDEVMRETSLIDSRHVFETTLEIPTYLEADHQLIKQAIRILMDNSIKYTPEGEKIVLRVTSDSMHVRIVVQDNGIGIPPEDVTHIFDRFYRSDESRARKTGGAGLGLAIAKWIVERHGGYFEVLSRVDIGTRATMVFPSTLNR